MAGGCAGLDAEAPGASVFGVDPKAVVLYYVPEPGALPTYLDDDDMPLSYFGVHDGATIDINDKVDDQY